MYQRVQVKDMVMQLHERNLVLMNIIRDIAENERCGKFSVNSTDEEICRVLNDKSKRRNELLGEIEHFLYQHDMATRVGA